MTDLAQLQTALAALAAEVERLNHRLDQSRTETARAQETADNAHRVLVDIIDRVKDIADQRTGTDDPDQPTPVVAWLTIDDPAAARVALGELVNWLKKVFVHYPGAVEALGECWLWHPAAIEELMALRSSWHAAYTGTDATAARAIDWHERHLPGVTRRLRTALGDCSIAAHRRGGRADHLTPPVPAAAAADNIAQWWTTSHGTTTPPPPTPDIEATLTHH